jgi:iron complex outermembrane receptor protein
MSKHAPLRSSRTAGVLLLTTVSMGWGLQSLAQTTAPESTDPLQEVVVTGSRIARSGFTSPTPVTTIGAEELERLAITNIGAGISQLPAFRPSNSPTTNGFGSFNVGAQIVNLRGLGVTRNLILVDGRRFAPTTREGSVDLNLVPSILIERTEVVTGGASAAYGSDAVAGVVNVILNKTLTGLRSQFDYGVSDAGDGDNYHAALAGGTDLFGGRGHLVIGGEYDKQDGIGNCFERDWCRPGQVVNRPATLAGSGLPARIRSNDNAGFWMNSAGVVAPVNNTGAQAASSAAVRNLFGTGGITFAPDGTPVAYQPGQIASGLTQIGGDITPTYLNTNLTIPVERYTLFGHSTFAFNDNLEGFFEASYGYVTGSVLQSSFFDSAIPIFRDNAFMPAAVRAAVGPAGAFSGVRPANTLAVFNLGRTGDDLARGLSESSADVYRATTGLKGRFGDTRWTWDTYYQYARTDRLQTVRDNRIQGDPAVVNNPARGISDPASFAYFSWAADAVMDTETAITPGTGTIVCRATLSPDAALRAAAAGCAPLNLFGAGARSDAARNYVYGTLVEDIDISQHVLAANTQGSVAELWAGPLSLAGGVEFRRDEMDVVHDDLSNLFAYFQNFGADYDGKSKVIEGYLEAELPLVRDAAWAKALSVNVAGRHARYELEGFGSYLRAQSEKEIDADTWKASLIWDVTDWLRLRTTRSRDVRAPNFADLYLSTNAAFAPVFNPFRANAAEFPRSVGGGNSDVDEETANTITFGLVFQPQWGWSEGLRLSADYYDIEVEDYIANPGAQFIADRCFAGVARACNQIVFGPNDPQGRATFAEVRNISQNLDKLTSKGVDIEIDYALPLGFNFRVLATYVDELVTQTFGVAIDRAGQTGNLGLAGMPEWLLNAYLSYSAGPLSLTVQGRYIDSGTWDAQWVGPDESGYNPTAPDSISNNEVASAFYVNLFGNYNFVLADDRTLQFFATVNNLLDREPPFAPELQYPTNPTFFDQIGRSYRVGARYKF